MTPEPNIDVKAITIEFLEAQPIGARFTPMDIHRLVSFRSNGHRDPYRDTIAHYIREWRRLHGYDVPCISKRKSMYEIRRK